MAKVYKMKTPEMEKDDMIWRKIEVTSNFRQRFAFSLSISDVTCHLCGLIIVFITEKTRTAWRTSKPDRIKVINSCTQNPGESQKKKKERKK